MNRFPSLVYGLSFFGAFVAGAGSYQKTCLKKIMSLENSVIAEHYRKAVTEMCVASLSFPSSLPHCPFYYYPSHFCPPYPYHFPPLPFAPFISLPLIPLIFLLPPPIAPFIIPLISPLPFITPLVFPGVERRILVNPTPIDLMVLDHAKNPYLTRLPCRSRSHRTPLRHPMSS